ncbi:Hemolysin-type calcium-binding repeat-containing protein [Jannaschia faecimaris]|uniref:Hemolysin-type calcium-binding repeat-containing protein n=1 Tax=Jannaschia faecimaris TaxID=1244108 RepID=A0A1H3IH59_9RHOB|nr:right-handed parallel beta-helix repeat-containing protein [Jannaschia faecimaris]SDY27146.1 Hemolysin-type calcium-binding repeat-containing protein [Jannaschia faecimaris]
MNIANDVFVSSAAELTAALDAATGGETIWLASGHYGDLGISPKHLTNSQGVYDSKVTIRSVDPDDPAELSGVNISGGQNIHFADLKFEFAPQEGDGTRTIMFNVRNWSPADRDAENISVENSLFTGLPVSEENGGDPSNPEDVYAHDGNVAGLSTGVAFSARGVQDVTFTGNEVTGFFRGVVFSESDNVVFTENYIHDLRSDGANFAAVTNVLIEGNEIRDMTPWRHEDAIGKGDHADLIQFWTAGTTTPSENIVIRNNLLHVSEGDASQSIFMRNEMVDSGGAGLEMFYRNILIEDNLIYNSQANATRVGEGIDITIRNNTYIHNTDHSGSSVNTPAIRVALDSQNVIIENNIVPRIANQEAMEGLGFLIRNNLVTQNTDPNGENYVGNLFIDALSGRYSSVVDLQLLPGNPAVGLGIGAEMSQFNETPEALTAIALTTSGAFSGDDFQFTFDAGLTADAQGFTDDRVSYHWDFGDGTEASGLNAGHRYEAPGEYVVTLTVTSVDGVTSVNQTMVEIDNPTLFTLGLSESGVSDASSYETAITGEGVSDAIVTLEDGSLAYHLTNDSTLTLERSASQLYSHDQFTFSLDLKRDMATDGGGYVMMWISSMRLRMDDEGFVTFDFWNADEEHFELVSQGAIQDTEWHNLAISYNSHEQEAVLYLDGEAFGSGHFEGFTDVQESWGMQLGYTFKDNFEGLIRNVSLSNVSIGETVEVTPLPEVPNPTVDPTIENQTYVQEGGYVQGGTELSDLMIGTVGDDVVKGLDGDDVFRMGAGDDLVNAGAGDDLMYGGDGNDILQGFAGTDTAYGGSGDDLIYANIAYGEAGNDNLRGGSSSDYLVGGDGNDFIQAGEADDVLIGGSGADVMKGGNGNDVLVADMDDLTINGGAGTDIALFFAAQGSFQFADKMVVGVEELDFTNALQNTVEVGSISNLRQSDTDELIIRGDVGDIVRSDLDLDYVGQDVRDGVTYDRYAASDDATFLLVDVDMTVDWTL